MCSVGRTWRFEPMSCRWKFLVCSGFGTWRVEPVSRRWRPTGRSSMRALWTSPSTPHDLTSPVRVGKTSRIRKRGHVWHWMSSKRLIQKRFRYSVVYQDRNGIRIVLPDPDQARHPGRTDPDPGCIRIILPDPDRHSKRCRSTALVPYIVDLSWSLNIYWLI